MSDDATRAYVNDRLREDAPEEQKPSREEVLAQIKAEIAAEIAAEEEAAAQGGTDGVAPAADGVAPAADGVAPAADGVSPAAPDPNLLPPTPLAPNTLGNDFRGKATDIRNSVARAIPKAAANTVDFGARALDGALEYLGVPPETFSSGTATGDLVDKLMGTPETTAGSVIQDIVGIAAPMRAITGPLQYASKLKVLATGIFGSALFETALTSDKAGGLSNIGQSMPEDHWSNNFVTEMLALEKDDSNFQKFAKRFVENMIVNKGVEVGANVAGKVAGPVAGKVGPIISDGLVRLRGVKKDLAAVSDTATEAGMATAPKVEQAVAQAAVAQHEADVVQAVLEEAKPKTLTGPAKELADQHEALKTTLEDVSSNIEAAQNSLKAAASPKDKKALKAALKEFEGQRAALMDELKATEARLDPAFVARVGELEALDGAVEALTREADTLTKQMGEAAGLAKGPLAKRLKKVQGQLQAAESERAALKGAQTAPAEAPAPAAPAAPGAPAAPAGATAGGVEPLRERLRALREEYGKMQPKGGGLSDDPAALALRSQIDQTIDAIRKAETQGETGRALQQKFGSPDAGGAPAAPGAAQAAPAEAPVLPPEVVGGLEKKAKFASDEAFDRTESIVKGIEELDETASPEYLNGIKESAIEGGIKFTPEQIARMDAAIAARTASIKPVKDQVFGAHLTMTKEDMTALQTALLAGDFQGATQTLGKVIGDTTNFNKIAASGDVTDLLATMMDWFGKDEKSYRLLESRSRPATIATAQDELEALAKKHGTDANAIRMALEKQFPGRDLTKTLTAYRILEASVAQQSIGLAKLVRFGGQGELGASKELSKMLALTGIINDRRAGLVSDIARALNSLQEAVEPTTLVLRAAAQEARDMGYEAFVQAHGGGMKNMERLADMILSAGNDADAIALVGKAATLTSGTLGDAAYAFVIHNTLSGFLTPLKNVTSSAFYQGLWKPFDNMGGAIGRDLYNAVSGGDAVAIRKEVRRIRATYAEARKSLATDSIIRRNMRMAWETGQRQTTPGGAFMEHLGATGQKVTRLGEGNMARATELARTLRDGGQVKLPFGPRIKAGAAIFGQGRLNRMAEALDASAETRRLWSPLSADPQKEIAKRYGLAAKVVDYTGRVNSWPMHALATGDEWNAAIAKSGALEAETFEAVHKMGLRGDEAEAYIRDVIDNIHTIPDLLKKADEDALTPSQLRRLELMQEVAEKSDDYVREVTFTQSPDAVTQLAAHARSSLPGARWMMYFVRTPGNIMKAGMLNNPVGRGVASVYELAAKDKAGAAEQLGRAATASAAALGFYEMIASGLVTGGGPSDPDAFALWSSVDGGGNTPYTARIPGTSIVINYGSFIDPIGIPMQVLADLAESAEYMDEPTFAAFAEEFQGRFHRLLESKSYLASFTDMMDVISGRADLSKTIVRIGRNFVPQSRLLASLRTSGLPVPKGVGKAIIGAEGPDDQFMSVQELIDGNKYKGIIDRGTGVMLNDKGELVDIHGGVIDSPLMVSLVSTIAEDLPQFAAEPWLEFHAKVLGVRAQHGKFPQRDQLGEKRALPVGYGPQIASGVLSEKRDPVREELLAVGMDKNVAETFGQFMGVQLTPEQQDFYQRRYRRPNKKADTAEEMFAKAIASDDYKKLGETVGSIKGARFNFLNSLHDNRLAVAQAALMDEFPELRAVLIQKAQQPAQMATKTGTDALQAKQAAEAPALLRAFQEAVNNGDY